MQTKINRQVVATEQEIRAAIPADTVVIRNDDNETFWEDVGGFVSAVAAGKVAGNFSTFNAQEWDAECEAAQA